MMECTWVASNGNCHCELCDPRGACVACRDGVEPHWCWAGHGTGKWVGNVDPVMTELEWEEATGPPAPKELP